VRRLTGCQPRLYAYITTLVLDPHEADDVLQQANLVMWEKLDEFLACENFDALACRVAYFQVMPTAATARAIAAGCCSTTN